jgi:hypothetical protein
MKAECLSFMFSDFLHASVSNGFPTYVGFLLIMFKTLARGMQIKAVLMGCLLKITFFFSKTNL